MHMWASLPRSFAARIRDQHPAACGLREVVFNRWISQISFRGGVGVGVGVVAVVVAAVVVVVVLVAVAAVAVAV